MAGEQSVQAPGCRGRRGPAPPHRGGHSAHRAGRGSGTRGVGDGEAPRDGCPAQSQENRGHSRALHGNSRSATPMKRPDLMPRRSEHAFKGFAAGLLVIAAILVVNYLTGCATIDTGQGVVTNTLEKFAPCPVEMPAKLDLALADYTAMQAYITELETRLTFCRAIPK